MYNKNILEYVIIAVTDGNSWIPDTEGHSIIYIGAYLATDSTSNLLLARQSSMMTCGGCPSRLADVQLFKTASEVKEVVGGGNTSMPSVSQAHFIALKIS